MKLYTQSACVGLCVCISHIALRKGLEVSLCLSMMVWKRIRANCLNSAFQKFEMDEQMSEATFTLQAEVAPIPTFCPHVIHILWVTSNPGLMYVVLARIRSRCFAMRHQGSSKTCSVNVA